MKVRIAIILAACLLAPLAQAELYRWTDENGKVHFSDRKQDEKAEAIDDELGPVNVDESRSERRKLNDILRQEDPAEQRMQDKNREERRKEQQKRCRKARSLLNTLEGRVAFVDKNGKDMKISEDERQRRAERVRQYIQNHCR